MRVDPTGEFWEAITDKISETVLKFCFDSIEFGIKVGIDLYNYNDNNTNEQKVIDSYYFSNYKGQFVVRIPGTASASYRVMFLGKETKNTNVVRHEYGHYLQLQELGWTRYTAFIAAPSLTSSLIRKNKNSWLRSNKNYHSLPWEVTADILGGANYSHHKYAEGVGWFYFDLISPNKGR